MSTAAEHIGLTRAVTWIAFGVEHNAREFLQELASGAYGVGREAAYDKFLVGLSKLLKSAFDGAIILRGRYAGSPGNGVPQVPQTIKIDPLMMADYRVLDFGFEAISSEQIPRPSQNSFDILRRGKPHLLWVPRSNDGGYALPSVPLDSFIECVSLARGDLQKCFKAGVSAQTKSQLLMNLSEAELYGWWAGLSPQEQGLGRSKLAARLQADFPNHRVPRSRLRGLTGQRKAGRPKKSARD